MNYSLTNTTFHEEIYSITAEPVVVIPKSWELVTAAEKLLLEKILGLAQQTSNNVKIVSSQKPDVLQWSELPPSVIAFGLELPGLAKNEILDVHGVKVIVTLDLTSLESADKETKQKLAGAVRSLF